MSIPLSIYLFVDLSIYLSTCTYPHTLVDCTRKMHMCLHVLLHFMFTGLCMCLGHDTGTFSFAFVFVLALTFIRICIYVLVCLYQFKRSQVGFPDGPVQSKTPPTVHGQPLSCVENGRPVVHPWDLTGTFLWQSASRCMQLASRWHQVPGC